MNCLWIIGYNMEIIISSARIVCIMLKLTLHVYSNSSFGIVSLHYCTFLLWLCFINAMLMMNCNGIVVPHKEHPYHEVQTHHKSGRTGHHQTGLHLRDPGWQQHRHPEHLPRPDATSGCGLQNASWHQWGHERPRYRDLLSYYGWVAAATSGIPQLYPVCFINTQLFLSFRNHAWKNGTKW